jgi:hypothetical protein
MKPEPKILCPVCLKKYFNYDQAMVCAEADIKEAMAKKRRLKLIRTTK